MADTVVCDIHVETTTSTGYLANAKSARGAVVAVGKHPKTGELHISAITGGKGKSAKEIAVPLSGAMALHNKFIRQGKASIRLPSQNVQVR